MEMDHTRTIAALQRRKIDMMSEKKIAEIEVKEKYAARIREEIQRRTEEAEQDFAAALREAVEEGVPQSLLRSEVLRTNDWRAWTKWRDLAQIEPERVKNQDAKNARVRENATFVWADDYSTLTVQRDSKGQKITPVVYLISGMPVPTRPGDLWWPDAGNTADEGDAVRGDGGYLKMLSAEIQSKYEEGVLNI